MPNVTIICKECEQPFALPRWRMEGGRRGRFCSNACALKGASKVRWLKEKVRFAALYAHYVAQFPEVTTPGGSK